MLRKAMIECVDALLEGFSRWMLTVEQDRGRWNVWLRRNK